MQKSICLEAVNAPMQQNFTNIVAHLLGMKPSSNTIVEHKFSDDFQVRYTQHNFNSGNDFGLAGLETWEGIMIVGTRIMPIRDVVLHYETGRETAVVNAIKKLFLKHEYLLVDDNLKHRWEFLQGTYRPRVSREKLITKAAKQYLLWQIYGVNSSARALLLNHEEKLLIRQLRVKIRRLRSCLIFFKHLFPEKQFYTWQQTWRSAAENLSVMRELDVALMTCDRMSTDETGAAADLVAPQTLQKEFLRLRQNAGAKFYEQHSLNNMTLQCVRFSLWLQRSLFLNTKKQKTSTYVAKRMQEWKDNLESLAEKYPDFRNVQNLHKIRIKVKRFRYVIQTIELNGLNNSLLRKLKRLQDLLGFLHDDYVNAIWAEKIAQKAKKSPQLVADISSFVSWGKGKADSTLAILPDLWQDFLQELAQSQS
jgi:CHAD domain-containing protein